MPQKFSDSRYHLQGERSFFVMKLIKGETLSKLLAHRKEPTAERGRFIGIFDADLPDGGDGLR